MEKEENQRSIQQNKSLHKYCTTLSEQMNEAGYDQIAVLGQFNEGMRLPWTMESVKNIFREIARVMYGCESTANLDTKQIQEVYKVIDLRISEITSISVEWPSLEAMSFENIENHQEN